MKVIIAGSRSITDMDMLERAIRISGFKITEVVSGGALGADRLGEEWAKKNKIDIRYYPANWNEHGKAAGHIRNSEMAEYADALIALWDGISNGTRDMIKKAKHHGLRVQQCLL